MTFLQTLMNMPFVLTEGAIIERIRRCSEVELDPSIVHAGFIYDERGRETLTALYREYLDLGQTYDVSLITLAPTWRANPERVQQSPWNDCRAVNIDNIRFMQALRDSYGSYADSIFIGGMMACRGDAYIPGEALSWKSAQQFHREQAEALAQSGVDFIKAATLPALSEAYGIASTLSQYDVPYIIGFIVRPEGTLLDGTPLHKAIAEIDVRVSPAPCCYMINCVHPTVFERAIEQNLQHAPDILKRVWGLQANTSDKSPEELNHASDLDTITADEFADLMAELQQRWSLKILGGCCGTDSSHIDALARRLLHR